ncbi:MAG: type I-C CRISPR-associated protein Cas8c/Csd1, partial [Christensenellaceae bacterium]|nr:type I-C CRISPR-associated protein Cas8c/Csd1 [Christensenellaceae bacterium]
LRIKAEQGASRVTRGRAAILKAYLLEQLPKTKKEVLTVALNEQSNERAYVLGRLFSLLEQIQEAANPGINTTISDRFFTSACTTPLSVFPTLLRLSMAHIAKLEGGLPVSFERQKTAILGKLEVDEKPFPNQLDLQEQGLFILGYYHQTQARYTKKEG